MLIEGELSQSNINIPDINNNQQNTQEISFISIKNIELDNNVAQVAKLIKNAIFLNECLPQKSGNKKYYHSVSRCLDKVIFNLNKKLDEQEELNKLISNHLYNSKKNEVNTPNKLSHVTKQRQSKTVNQTLKTTSPNTDTDTNVYVEDIINIAVKLESKIIDTTSHNISQSQQNKLVKQLNKVNSLLNCHPFNNEYLTKREIALLSLYFEAFSNALPQQESTANLKELTNLLSKNLKSNWAKFERDCLIDDWAKDFSPLFEPGAIQDNSISIGLNTGISAISIPKVSDQINVYANVGTNLTLGKAIMSDDDGGVMTFDNKSISGNISAGAKASLTEQIGASAGLECNYNYTNAKVDAFMGIKEMSEAKGHNDSSLSREHYLPTPNKSHFFKLSKIAKFIKSHLPFRTNSEMQQLYKIQQQAINSESRLNQLIESEFKIKTNLHAFAPEYPNIVSGAIAHINTAQLTAQANAEFSALNARAGAATTITMSKLDVCVPLAKSFTDSIKENPKRLKQLPPNYYKHAKDIILDLDIKKNFTPSLTALRYLKTDVENYFETVKHYDYLKSLGNLANKADLKKYRNSKHEIEQRWGAVGRHQFIQFSAASHAYLTNNIIKNKERLTPEQTDSCMELINSLDKTIYNPSIEHSPNHIKKLINMYGRFLIQNKDKVLSFTISAGPLSGILNVVIRDKIHPNIFREGSSIDINFTLNASIQLQNLPGIKTLNDKLNEKITEILAEQGISSLNTFSIIPVLDGSISTTYSTRFLKPMHDKYIGESVYRKLYTRKTDTLIKNIHWSPSGQVMPTVTIGGNIGLTSTKTRFISEQLGTRDLTYPSMLYRTYYLRHDNNKNNSEWCKFESDHQSELHELCKNLGNKNERVHREALQILDHAMASAKSTAEALKVEEFKSEFIESMKKVYDNPDNKTYIDTALANLNNLFEFNTQIATDAYSSRIIDHKPSLTSNSALTLGSKFKKLFS